MSVTIEIHSPLPPHTALQRLRERVGRPPTLLAAVGLGAPAAPLRGAVTGPGFRVAMNAGYRNSFAAVCRGAIEPAGGGSRLRATVGLPWFVVPFLAVWCAGVLIALSSAAARGAGWRDAAIPAALLGGATLVVMVGRVLHRAEARTIRAELEDVMGASARASLPAT